MEGKNEEEGEVREEESPQVTYDRRDYQDKYDEGFRQIVWLKTH